MTKKRGFKPSHSKIKMTVAKDLFAGGGEMGELMRTQDWSQTLLGSVSQWTQSLKTTVSLILNSRYPMFIWWGTDYAKLYNDAYRPILGASKHPQFLGQSAKDCWADIWDVLGPMADSVMNTGQPTWSEDLLLIMDRNGYLEETYFTFSYSPVRDENGRVEGVFCACAETTKQIIGERRLKTLRELAAKGAEAKTVAEAYRLSAQALSTNPYDIPFALLYQVEPEGQQAHLMATAGLEAGVNLTQYTDHWNLAQVIQTGQTQYIEPLPPQLNAFIGGVWEELPKAALVIPITQIDLLIIGISPRREFDDEYSGFFDLVANQVATAINNTRAYEEERKRAEALVELDRAKTVFFSNISHEFRTPLTLLLNPLEDILSNCSHLLPVTEQEQLAMAQRNGLRLLKLVNTLLDFSRIEAGRIQAVYEPTDLATFTAELASIFRSAIERAGMRLKVDCPPFSELIYIDREMWEKIVLNLLSNAFKFTFAGEITVSLHAKDDQVELNILDTGIGIPPEEIPHLFERFYRVEGAKGRTFEGSGIGLSLVQELVHLHGGTIRVSSVVDQGTCFTVSIPQGSAHLPQDRISAVRTLTSSAIEADSYVEEALRWLPEGKDGGDCGEEGDEREGGNREESYLLPQSKIHNLKSKILLVDDNADMRDYIQRLLSQYYIVESVPNGMAALAAVRQQLPDLVLTDVMMPGMDGFELLQQLRGNPQTQNLPIILLSARAGEESRIEGLQAGADDYLIKPFSARELLARVESTLKMAQMRQEMVRREQERQLEAEIASEKLERLLASINDGFLILDRNWNYTYVNDRLAEINGTTKEDLLGKNLWEVFPDLKGTQFAVQIQQAMTERTTVRFEYFYPTWNRWFENHIYPYDEGIAVLCTEITERKQTEQALRESEERFRLAARAVAGIVYDWDVQTGQVYRSEGLYQLMGVHPQEVPPMQQWWSARIHTDDFARIEAIFNPIVAGGGDYYDFEYRMLHEEGHWVEVWDRGYLIRDEKGQLCRVVGSTADISERKRAEMALRESEERFRQMAETLQDVFWMSNLQNKQILYVSPAYERIWGKSCENLYANPLSWVEAIHPEDRQRVWTTFRKQVLEGTFDQEYRIIRSDGSIRWVRDRGYPILEENVCPRQAVGLAEDITERKAMEAALRESTAILNAVNQTTPTLIFVKDRQGRMVMANPATLSAIGKSEEEIIGKTTEEFIANPDEAKQMRENDRWVMETGQIQVFEEIADLPIGKRIFLSTKSPYRDEQGNIIGLIGVATDITERKQTELILEQRARELTEVNQTLSTTMAMLQERNEELDQFAYAVSHDLKAPLRAIANLSQWLEDDLKDQLPLDNQRQLQLLRQRVYRLDNLIDALLQYSRIGRTNTSVESIAVAELLAEIIDSLSPPPAFRIDIGPNMPTLTTQRVFLAQIFANLISNAIKHHPRENGRVDIRVIDKGNFYEFSISDDGKGIAPEHHQRIFALFQTLASRDTHESTGIGLTLVKKIVETQGGTIWVESQVGGGATFRFSWPK